ncbi:MAG: hypothetical protein D6788_02825, partial [Planctomycetota bacterium]
MLRERETAEDMIPRIQRKILTEVLSLPTAPFAEHFVIDYVEAFCRRRNVPVERDPDGNLLVH